MTMSLISHVEKSIRATLLMKRLLILGGILALPFSGFATVLFDQSSNIEPDGFFSDAISTNGSQFYGQAIGDDFTIASNSVINTITFWGESENFLFDDSQALDGVAVKALHVAGGCIGHECLGGGSGLLFAVAR